MSVLKNIRAGINAAASLRKDLNTALSEIRAGIAGLEEKRQGALDARLSADEIRAAVKSHLDSLEKEALDRLAPESFGDPSGLPNSDRIFAVKSAPVYVPAGGGAINFHPAFHGVGSLCVLGLRATVEKSLVDHALSAANGGGPSAAERAATLATIETDLQALELAEEALIRESEEAGIPVARRPNANPAIYLRRKVS